MHFGRIVKTALLAELVHGYANPGGCSGPCNVHDPALIQRSSDDRYFRFSTGNRISYASAPSINGPWTALGSMLPSGSSIDLAGRDDLWVSWPGRSMTGSFQHVKIILNSLRGPRCSPCERSLPCLLLRIDIRFAGLSPRAGHIGNHGAGLLD